MKKHDIKILLDKDGSQNLEKILKDLNSRGFEKSYVFKEIGLLFGKMPDSEISLLADMSGISRVSAERLFLAIDDTELSPLDPDQENNNNFENTKIEENKNDNPEEE